MVAPTPDNRHAIIAEEAAMWLEKLERVIGSDESRELRRWLRSSDNRQAIVARCKLWHGPEILAVLGELVPLETFSQRVERNYGRIVLAMFLCISGLGFATVVIGVSKLWPSADANRNPMRAEATFRTGAGERRNIHLPDGGSILMNSETRLQFNYRPHSRDVILIRGEAAFDIEHDVDRPFIVQAGGRLFEVQSGGSAFALQRVDTDRVELVVMRGEVHALRGRSRSPLTPALIRARATQGAHIYKAGEGGTLGVDWQLPALLPPEELDRRLAWREAGSRS